MATLSEMTTLPDGLKLLLDRRSISTLVGPPPTRAEIALMLQAASTVPDHGELRPYRFVVVDTDEGRQRFGDALASAIKEAKPDAPAGLCDKARKKAFAAPALVILIASPLENHAIPVWEQVASASCCGFAIALAAHALGLGAIWKTANTLDGEALRRELSLGSAERILGWINVGQPNREALAAPREPVDLQTKAAVLEARGLVALEASGA